MKKPERLTALLLLMAACGSGPAHITECRAAGDIEPICGLQNPEDLGIGPFGEWLIVSQYAGPAMTAEQGSIVAIKLTNSEAIQLFPPIGRSDWLGRVKAQWGSPACPGPPLTGFAPHGIDLRSPAAAQTPMLVVNHGARESIEIFELLVQRGKSPSLQWRGCVLLPPGTTGNDVAFLPDSGFVVTHMMEPGGQLHAFWTLLKSFLGASSGYVLEWKPERGWRKVPGTEESFPNGIVASADGKYLWFASWLGNRVVRISRDGSEPPVRIDVAHPDNLSWAEDGRILVASQHSISELLGCSDLEAGSCGAGFSILAIDPQSFKVETLLEQRGDPMGAGTVGLQVGRDLYIGSFAGDRVGRARGVFR